MHLTDYVAESLDSLRKHPMRGVLTMLGITVGVFTVILTLAIGAGARLAIQRQIDSLGSNLIVVNSGPPPSVGRQPVLLYPEDARAILEQCAAVADVSPQQETRLPLAFGADQLADNFVMGVTPSYGRVRLAQVEQGRFLSAEDDRRVAKVAVLGSTVRQYLFGAQDPLGQRILVSGVDFQVIAPDPRGYGRSRWKAAFDSEIGEGEHAEGQVHTQAYASPHQPSLERVDEGVAEHSPALYGCVYCPRLK